MGPYRQFGQKGHYGQNGTLWTKWDIMDKMGQDCQYGQNGTIWTKWDIMDKIGPNWILLTKWDKMEQN